MKKRGIMLKLPDDRKVIVYENQPLAKEKNKIILNLIDDKFKLMHDETGKPRIIIKDVNMYNLENEQGVNRVIGYVD